MSSQSEHETYILRQIEDAYDEIEACHRRIDDEMGQLSRFEQRLSALKRELQTARAVYEGGK